MTQQQQLSGSGEDTANSETEANDLLLQSMTYMTRLTEILGTSMRPSSTGGRSLLLHVDNFQLNLSCTFAHADELP